MIWHIHDVHPKTFRVDFMEAPDAQAEVMAAALIDPFYELYTESTTVAPRRDQEGRAAPKRPASSELAELELAESDADNEASGQCRRCISYINRFLASPTPLLFPSGSERCCVFERIFEIITTACLRIMRNRASPFVPLQFIC